MFRGTERYCDGLLAEQAARVPTSKCLLPAIRRLRRDLRSVLRGFVGAPRTHRLLVRERPAATAICTGLRSRLRHGGGDSLAVPRGSCCATGVSTSTGSPSPRSTCSSGRATGRRSRVCSGTTGSAPKSSGGRRLRDVAPRARGRGYPARDAEPPHARGGGARRSGHGGAAGGPNRLRPRRLHAGRCRHSPPRRCGDHCRPALPAEHGAAPSAQAEGVPRAEKGRRPQMSDVWYARQIAGQAAGCHADASRKHMTGGPGAPARCR